MTTCGVQQVLRSEHVGTYERLRAVDRPVDVALGRQVEDGVGPFLLEERTHASGVRDVEVHEAMVGGSVRFGEALAVAGVGERVDGDDAPVAVAYEPSHDRRADEAGAAGHQDGPCLHHVPTALSNPAYPEALPADAP